MRTGEHEFTTNVPLLSPSTDADSWWDQYTHPVFTEHKSFFGTFSLSAKDMVEPCKWTLVKNNIGDKGEKLDFTRGLQLKAEVSAPTQEQWNQLYSRAASIQMIMLLFDAKGNLVHSCEEGTIARDEEIHTLSTEFLMNNNLLTPSSKYTACVAFLISGDGTTQWQELWTSKMENPIIPVWFSEKFTFTTPSQKEYDKAKAYEQEQEH